MERDASAVSSDKRRLGKPLLWAATSLACFAAPLRGRAAPPANSAAPAPVEATRAIRIEYGLAAWNVDSTKIDEASLIMREGTSGKLVQIALVETAADSSIFSGLYSVNWSSLQALAPEFYVPPQALLTTNDGMKKIAEMIERGELKRRPFILQKMPRDGRQQIDIYDTREQARAAMRAFRAERDAVLGEAPGAVGEPIQPAIEGGDDDARKAYAKAEAKAEQETAARESKRRVRIDQVESAKSLARLRVFQALEAEQKAELKKRANEAAAEGMAAYRASNSDRAKELFGRAMDLDPENQSYAFRYGVALYKTGDPNRAIVFLKNADGADVDPYEKSYFLGLCWYRLRSFAEALEAFENSRKSPNPEIRASSAYYRGVSEFEEKRYSSARPLFQDVLETSEDPDLSRKAEAYIDQILRLQNFETERAKKWTIRLNLGEIYDTDVTLAATSAQDQGSATDVAGFRSLYQSSIKYRPIYDFDHEFATQLDLLYLFTVDQSLQFNQNLKNADPFIATLTFPWTYKGVLWGKSYKLDFVPGLESTWMSVDQNQEKEILNSILLSAINTFALSESWQTSVNLETRRDDSELSYSVGNEDSSAFRYKLSWGNVISLDPGKAHLVLTNLAYTTNQAQGVDESYDRYDAGASYVGKLPWSLLYNLGFACYYLTYPSPTNGRADDSFIESLGVTKKLDDQLALSFTLAYDDNESNMDSDTYQKWTAMLTLTSGWHF